VITGTDFVTSDTATVSFQSINADSVSIDSATQVTATFSDGVPITPAVPAGGSGYQPILTFTRSSDSVQLMAKIANSVTIENP
jgi:hypothetical protein